MSITTKTGDDGSTGLWSGERVGKDDPRIEACGEIDELSSFLGFARLACRLGETDDLDPCHDVVEPGDPLGKRQRCAALDEIGSARRQRGPLRRLDSAAKGAVLRGPAPSPVCLAGYRVRPPRSAPPDRSAPARRTRSA